jgi:SAM-dependent methyltransferase
MYWPFAEDLERFYSGNLGAFVRSTIRSNIKCLWPDFSNSSLTTLGIGYCQPLLIYRNSRFIAVPHQMKPDVWPSSEESSLCKVEENSLPFPDNSFHRIIISHTMEYTREPSELMEEIWRILAPEGKVIIIVPNRSRSWAHSHITPFGYGTPYSKTQITGMLQQVGFSIGNVTTSLIIPPSNNYTLIRFSMFAENFICSLRRCDFLRTFGGVILVEGYKRVYCPDSGNRNAGVVFKPVSACSSLSN